MSIVNNLDRIVAWLNKEVCTKIKLKLPDDDDSAEGYNSKHKMISPSAFPLYVPANDRIPPKVMAPIPSVCACLVDGKDDLLKSRRTMKIRLSFAAWNPGTHGLDFLKPKPNTPGVYTIWRTEEAIAFYERNSEGWRDLWNFVDVALREIETAEYIGGYRVLKENGITFGLYKENDLTIDYYPYWFGWVELDLYCDLIRATPDFEKYL